MREEVFERLTRSHPYTRQSKVRYKHIQKCKLEKGWGMMVGEKHQRTPAKRRQLGEQFAGSFLNQGSQGEELQKQFGPLLWLDNDLTCMLRCALLKGRQHRETKCTLTP